MVILSYIVVIKEKHLQDIWKIKFHKFCSPVYLQPDLSKFENHQIMWLRYKQ